MQALNEHIAKDGFRLRGTQMSRIDGFSDVVFGFALTLLVVSLDVPKTYAEFHNMLLGFFPFFICFVFLIMLWWGHFRFFRRYGLHDTGAAMATLALQATADGLHTHSMAGFDNDLMRASFAIPSDYELGAVTAIGYFGDPASLPEHLQKMEVSPRQRKPLEEFVFSAWEKPAHF